MLFDPSDPRRAGGLHPLRGPGGISRPQSGAVRPLLQRRYPVESLHEQLRHSEPPAPHPGRRTGPDCAYQLQCRQPSGKSVVFVAVRQRAVTGDHWPYDRGYEDAYRHLGCSLAHHVHIHSKDRGCTAPGCTAPGYLCEVHHVEDWAGGGLINIDTLTFACAPHQKLLDQGWTTRRLPTGDTQWIPPPQLPLLSPGTNELHHPEKLIGDQGDEPA